MRPGRFSVVWFSTEFLRLYGWIKWYYNMHLLSLFLSFHHDVVSELYFSCRFNLRRCALNYFKFWQTGQCQIMRNSSWVVLVEVSPDEYSSWTQEQAFPNNSSFVRNIWDSYFLNPHKFSKICSVWQFWIGSYWVVGVENSFSNLYIFFICDPA